MKQRSFAVMGATGHIGQVITEELIKRGHLVRALGRDSDKLRKLSQDGANLIVTEFDDVKMLKDAFSNVYAVFSFIPPGYHEKDYANYQDRVSKAIVTALQESKAQRVVNLSSMGADLSRGTGPILGLHEHEKRLDALKGLMTLIHLRPTYFMENFNFYIPSILNQKVIRSPLDANLKLPMIAARDIGWKAADFLDSTATFPHQIFELVGPKEITMKQATEIFGKCLDLPGTRYEQITFEEARKEMTASGFSPKLVDMLLEMYKAFNENKIKPTQPLSLTHKGATTFEAFVQHLSHHLGAFKHGK